MSKHKPRRSFSPTTRRSKSPSSSSLLSLSRSSDMRSSNSRSPRSSRSPRHERSRRNSDGLDSSSNSRRRPVSRERRRGSPPSRRSVSPLSRRRRSPPPRCRSPLSSSSRSPTSSRRSKSPYRRSTSPRTLTWSSRRMSPTPTRGHRRSRSPPGKRQNVRQHSVDPANSSTSGRIRYPSKPGPMGRYNSRLGGEWTGEGEKTGQKKEWTCNQCSEIFFEQILYVEHVRERNLKGQCPGIEELLVLDDSPPVTVLKKERTRPAQKRSGPPTEVFLDDSPPYIALDLSDEFQTLPPSTADSDFELTPIVPPPGQSSLSLDPISDHQSLPILSLESISDQSLPTSSLELISDQSLLTSSVSTSAPTSLPGVPNTVIPLVALGSSPPRLPQEFMQSRVKLRDDGVLMFKEVTVQAKKFIKFKKNLFKFCPDLLDIPDTTNNNIEKSENEVKSTPAKVVTKDPEMFPKCEGLVLTKSLESANSLLQLLPGSLHPVPDKGAEPKKKLPKCLREDVEIDEPAVVNKVKAPKPFDEMELLLDKRNRQQFIKKKATPIQNSSESSIQSTKPNQCNSRPCKPSHNFDSALEQSVTVVPSVTKKRKKGKKRRCDSRKYKDKMKSLLHPDSTNVPTIPNSPSPTVESESTQPKEASQCPASLKSVVSSSPVHEHAILSPVSSCSSSESPIIPTSVPFVPSIFQMSLTSASPSVTAILSSTLSITPTPANTSISVSMSTHISSSVSGVRPTTSKHSTCLSITLSPLFTTTSSASTSLTSQPPNSPIPASMTSTSLLDEKLSHIVSSSSGSSDPKTENFTAKKGEHQYVDPLLGGVFTMASHLCSLPRVSSSAFTDTVSTSPSQPPSPIYGGEVMSLYQALGGSPSEDDHIDPPQPVIIRAGVDPVDKCPDCKARLETGPRALNFSLNMTDLSILVDCMQCGVRVRLKGVLGAKQRAVLGCGM